MINLSEKEEWRPVEDYPGYYVSDKGRVYGRSGKILNPSKNHKGYLYITGRKEKNTTLFVHRLVAKAFIPNPENKPEVNHIDGDKHNNCVENLEWVTAWENSDHAYRNGLSSWKVKLYPEQIEEIRQRRLNGESSADLAKEFNVSANTIIRHCKGINLRKISEKERNEIRQCYIDNMPMVEICKRFDRSQPAIEKCCRGLHRKHVITDLSKLTEDDILKIKRLHEEGLSYSKIGRIYGRTVKSIQYYCRKELDTA